MNLCYQYIKVTFVRSLGNVLPDYVELRPLGLAFECFEYVLELDRIGLLFKLLLSDLQLCHVSLALE